MYDDFKLCDSKEFERIAKEYQTQNKAQILDLSNDTQNKKKYFKNVLNKVAGLYFDLEQRKIKGFESIIKNIKKENLTLAEIYKEKFLEEFIPDIKTVNGKNIIFNFIDVIKELINLLSYSDLDALRQNILGYLNIIKAIFQKQNGIYGGFRG